jgi:hypothetical protein
LLWRSYSNRGLCTIPQIKRSPQFVSLDLSDNPLRDFTGLPTLPFLRVLRVDNTSIQSFKGALLYPSLETLSIRGCPLATSPNFNLMALLSFGTSIRVLNGRALMPDVTKAGTDPELCRWFGPPLKDGYLIVDVKQKIVWRPGAREQIILDLQPDEAARRQARIDECSREIEALKAKKRLVEQCKIQEAELGIAATGEQEEEEDAGAARREQAFGEITIDGEPADEKPPEEAPDDEKPPEEALNDEKPPDEDTADEKPSPDVPPVAEPPAEEAPPVPPEPSEGPPPAAPPDAVPAADGA